MAKYGIIAALTSEADKLSRALTEKTAVTINGGEYTVGKIGNNEVVICVCSIGKVNAAIKTQILIDKFGVEKIINTGIAGSLSKDAPHLSVVLSDKVFYHDFDVDLFQRYYPNCAFFAADEDMKHQFISANSDKNIVVGNIATGDVFVSDTTAKERINKICPSLACEMEGAAVAQTAYINKLPFIIVRCISDMADDNADFDYNSFEKTAADTVAFLVLSFLEA